MLIFKTSYRTTDDRFKKMLGDLQTMKKDGIILLPPDCILLAVTNDNEEISLEDENTRLTKEMYKLRAQEMLSRRVKEFVFDNKKGEINYD